MGFLVGSGLTVVHFFLSWELTSTTRLSFAHLRERQELSLWRSPYHLISCPQFMCSRLGNTYVCLALAEQYFLFLSASLSWPFLQHWPQTNIIFRFGGPNFLCALESCWWNLKSGSKFLCSIESNRYKKTTNQFCFNPCKIKSNFVFDQSAGIINGYIYTKCIRKTAQHFKLLVKTCFSSQIGWGIKYKQQAISMRNQGTMSYLGSL